MEKAVDSKLSSIKALKRVGHTAESASAKLEYYMTDCIASGDPQKIRDNLTHEERGEIGMLLMGVFADKESFPDIVQKRVECVRPLIEERKVASREEYLKKEIKFKKGDTEFEPFNHREWNCPLTWKRVGSIRVGERYEERGQKWDVLVRYRNAVEISKKLHPNLYDKTVERFRKSQ